MNLDQFINFFQSSNFNNFFNIQENWNENGYLYIKLHSDNIEKFSYFLFDSEFITNFNIISSNTNITFLDVENPQSNLHYLQDKLFNEIETLEKKNKMLKCELENNKISLIEFIQNNQFHEKVKNLLFQNNKINSKIISMNKTIKELKEKYIKTEKELQIL